jgi:hypothetical protein
MREPIEPQSTQLQTRSTGQIPYNGDTSATEAESSEMTNVRLRASNDAQT